jgi:voltage-gated potassium channel
MAGQQDIIGQGVQTTDVRPRHIIKVILASLLPSLVVVVALAAIYIWVPVVKSDESPVSLIVFGAIALMVYLALMSAAVVRLASAKHPVAEGVLLLTIMATLLILTFSYAYLSLDAGDVSAFTETLSKTSSVYFTVTVLSTVGFGDITPTTDVARMTVTGQMLLGITLLSVGVRVIVQSARTAKQNKT